jgi:tetratricopeptide (TPR) repeat protein
MGVDQELVGQLRNADLRTLGTRIRNLRLALGLTQPQLAGDKISVGYMSRIEAGQRRPNVRLIEFFAETLKVGAEELITGLGPARSTQISLDLLNAELALETGAAAEAIGLLEPIVPEMKTASGPIRERAIMLWARALEAAGRFPDAIAALEDWSTLAASEFTVGAAITLCRCYREAGDAGRAVEVGESALARLRDAGLDGADEAIQLVVTTAAAYFERGDETHAVRMAREAAARADQLGSPVARASAYWNASIFESERGDVPASITLAERALALLGEGRDQRNLARLRIEIGLMSMRLDPPDFDDAERYLKRARRELASSSGSIADIARCDIGLARVELARGNYTETETLASAALDLLAGAVPTAAAEAAALLGKLEAARGNNARALGYYSTAIGWLTGVGQDRGAAQLWVDLGIELEALGEGEAASDAFRRAAAATGLRVPIRSDILA